MRTIRRVRVRARARAREICNCRKTHQRLVLRMVCNKVKEIKSREQVRRKKDRKVSGNESRIWGL